MMQGQGGNPAAVSSDGTAPPPVQAPPVSAQGPVPPQNLPVPQTPNPAQVQAPAPQVQAQQAPIQPAQPQPQVQAPPQNPQSSQPQPPQNPQAQSSQIQQPQPTPQMGAYQQFLQNNPAPAQADYQPSMKRKVIGGIVGALAGVGNPAGGVATAKGIVNASYNKAMTGYNEQLNQKRLAAGVEAESQKNAAVLAEEQERAGAERSRAGAEEARRKTEEHKATEYVPTSKEDVIDIANAKKKPVAPKPIETGTAFIGDKQLKGVVHDANATSASQLYYTESPTGQLYIDPTTINKFEKAEQSPSTDTPKPIGTGFEALYSAYKKENGHDPDTAEITKMINASQPAALTMQRSSAATEAAGKVDPKTYDTIAESVKDNPMAAADMYEKLMGDPEKASLFSTAYKKATGRNPPRKLDQQSMAKEAASMRTQGMIKQTRSMLTDPNMKQFIGPIMGRAGELAQWSGGLIPGIPDNLQQKAQQLRGNLKYMLFGEGQSLVGTRVPAQLLKELSATSPRVDLAMPLLMGTLDNAEFQAKNTRDTNKVLMFGGEGASEEKKKTPLGQLLEQLGAK